MRPGPIPDDEILPGSQRIVVGPPPGHELGGDILAAEVCVRRLASFGGMPVLSTRCVLEPGDLEKLQAGGSVWVHFYGGQLLPFDVNVLSPGAPELATD
ncbi:hypothetical protein ACFWIW_10830 [Amycolatopsis sp. NPDC058340]|uniref:hypothetical protein n=1 Tax=Amycolatopsis sp. NPDC058340 TaxID=3346453 RepID=UPI0036552294